MAIPAVVAFLAFVLALGGVVGAQVTCADAARAGARAAALGENDAAVRATVRSLAGPTATVSIARDAQSVRLTVAKPVQLGPVGLGATKQASASAMARCEPARGCG
jgi:hypothetical protein